MPSIMATMPSSKLEPAPGKSIAYLLPSAFWAHQNGRRVVVSTNTINLQDQLINKDLPELQKALPFELKTAVRKGRSNYSAPASSNRCATTVPATPTTW